MQLTLKIKHSNAIPVQLPLISESAKKWSLIIQNLPNIAQHNSFFNHIT